MYLDAGFTDYLSKPVDGAKLERMLMDFLPEDKILMSEVDPSAKNMKKENHHEMEASSDLIRQLSNILEIDASAGLNNCGSEEGYRSVLMVFHRTAGAKADEIEGDYHSQNMGNYAVKVHALKSSARIIGAGTLSDLAQSLEDAAKNKDTEYVMKNTDKLLKMYRDLDDRLLFLDSTFGERPEISEEALQEAWQTIGEIAEVMDYGMMEDMLSSLRRYDLTKEDMEKVDRIEMMMTELDWDGILNDLKKEWEE